SSRQKCRELLLFLWYGFWPENNLKPRQRNAIFVRLLYTSRYCKTTALWFANRIFPRFLIPDRHETNLLFTYFFPDRIFAGIKPKQPPEHVYSGLYRRSARNKPGSGNR